MPIHDRATSVAVGGTGQISRDESKLLEQMTAPLGECPDCGTDGMFMTIWTPFRTVQRILCAVCLRSMWEAPTCKPR